MFATFQPTWQIESIYDLKASQLKKRNIKAVLTDLDNTLIAWNNPDGTPMLREWLQEMKKANILVIVVSNNNHARVKKALAKLDLPFISRALKPFSRGLRLALKRYNLTKADVVMVGDQLLTDVAAANHFKIRSILVKPIVESDAWNTKINRFFEGIIKNYLIKNNHFETRWGHKLNDR
ncbi:hypothetical protein SAMN05216431_102105 [Ligilactobacillus sp. WC1T17]|uniref:YqeG family HAD IIIA-type phosphatase n=1 Tax=Ligilactobacillus ruminis TaxID=1623 RepID=A0ABY1A9M8_9LACO|nr:hypothetical protein SAMN05216431_102105 [Ligilactobacillus ruminis]